MLYPMAGYHVKSAPICSVVDKYQFFPCYVSDYLARQEGTYINRKLARYPDKLGGVGLQLLDAAGVGLADVGSISTEGVDDIEVMTEHIRVLVIFLGDILADGGRQRKRC